MECEKTDRFTCYIRQYPPNWNVPQEYGPLPMLATFNFRWPTPSPSSSSGSESTPNELQGLCWWLTFPTVYKYMVKLPQFPVCPPTIVTSTSRRQLWIQVDNKWIDYAAATPLTEKGFPGFVVEKVPPIQEPRASEVDALRDLVEKFFYLSYGRINAQNSPLLLSPSTELQLSPVEQIKKLKNEKKSELVKGVESIAQRCKYLEGSFIGISTEITTTAEQLRRMTPKKNDIHNRLDSYERQLDKMERDLESEKYNFMTRTSQEHKDCLDALEALKVTMKETNSQLNEVKGQATQLDDLNKELAELKNRF